MSCPKLHSWAGSKRFMKCHGETHSQSFIKRENQAFCVAEMQTPSAVHQRWPTIFIFNHCSIGFTPSSNIRSQDPHCFRNSSLIIIYHPAKLWNWRGHLRWPIRLLFDNSKLWVNETLQALALKKYTILSAWEIFFKDPQSKPTLRMNSVVKEFSKRTLFWQMFSVIGWPIRIGCSLFGTKAKVSATSSHIVSYGVVWISYPKCVQVIVIQKTSTLMYKYCQVVLQDIALFNAVFYKKCSSPDIIYNIPLDQKVMCVMDSNSPVIGLVNCTAFYIRFKL